MFVKWECGCKGIKLGESCWVVDPCDSEDGSLTMYKRQMVDSPAVVMGRREYETLSEEDQQKDIPKKYEPLEQEESEELLEMIGRLIGHGYIYRDIKGIVKHMLRETDNRQ